MATSTHGKVIKYLLCPYYEPGIILGIKDIAVDKPSKKTHALINFSL